MPEPVRIELVGGPYDGKRLESPTLPERIEVEIPPGPKARYARTTRFTSKGRVIYRVVEGCMGETMDEVILNIDDADLVDPSDPRGRSYRQINAAKAHKWSIGMLVELEDGVRLWVVAHERDRDQAPAYSLAWNRDDNVPKRPGYANYGWRHGIPEDALRPVSG
jgi:hypothetical protein